MAHLFDEHELMLATLRTCIKFGNVRGARETAREIVRRWGDELAARLASHRLDPRCRVCSVRYSVHADFETGARREAAHHPFVHPAARGGGADAAEL